MLRKKPKMKSIDKNSKRYNTIYMEIIAIILLILWFGGFFLHIAGKLIHILLVIAIIVFLLRFISG